MALATPAAASPPQPHAQPRLQASGCEGVTVVVDFNRLGGGEQTRCAPGDPDSGVTALRGAGFAPTRAAQEAGYFVCRIDGKPADDPCQRASPEDAYWSYWHARPGGTWTFSNAGAAEHDPEPGTVEGWAFGGGEPPSSPPPSAPRRPAPARTTAPPQAPPAPAPAATKPAAAPAAPSARASARRTLAPSPAARASAAAVTPSPVPPRPSARAAAPSTAPGADVQEPLTADDPATPDEGSSPLVGVLVAVAVVAGLGAAAAVQAQRRR